MRVNERSLARNIRRSRSDDDGRAESGERCLRWQMHGMSQKCLLRVLHTSTSKHISPKQQQTHRNLCFNTVQHLARTKSIFKFSPFYFLSSPSSSSCSRCSCFGATLMWAECCCVHIRTATAGCCCIIGLFNDITSHMVVRNTFSYYAFFRSLSRPPPTFFLVVRELFSSNTQHLFTFRRFKLRYGCWICSLWLCLFSLRSVCIWVWEWQREQCRVSVCAFFIFAGTSFMPDVGTLKRAIQHIKRRTRWNSCCCRLTRAHTAFFPCSSLILFLSLSSHFAFESIEILMLLTSSRLMQNRACFFFVHCHLRCCRRRCRHFFSSDFFVHPVCCYCHLAFSHEKAHSQSMPTIWCGLHDRCLTCSHIRFITENLKTVKVLSPTGDGIFDTNQRQKYTNEHIVRALLVNCTIVMLLLIFVRSSRSSFPTFAYCSRIGEWVQQLFFVSFYFLVLKLVALTTHATQ